MGPVFGHGQLRLYLLAALEEGPLSGYDVIRGLEDRFGGLYSPSAGTVYPRLAKLEEEGLVTRTDEGRRSIYALTDQGRAELDGRRAELADLEASLDASAFRLATQMRERVRSGAADVRARLEEAARQARARAREADPQADPQAAGGFDWQDLLSGWLDPAAGPAPGVRPPTSGTGHAARTPGLPAAHAPRDQVPGCGTGPAMAPTRRGPRAPTGRGARAPTDRGPRARTGRGPRAPTSRGARVGPGRAGGPTLGPAGAAGGAGAPARSCRPGSAPDSRSATARLRTGRPSRAGCGTSVSLPLPAWAARVQAQTPAVDPPVPGAVRPPAAGCGRRRRTDPNPIARSRRLRRRRRNPPGRSRPSRPPMRCLPAPPATPAPAGPPMPPPSPPSP